MGRAITVFKGSKIVRVTGSGEFYSSREFRAIYVARKQGWVYYKSGDQMYRTHQTNIREDLNERPKYAYAGETS